VRAGPSSGARRVLPCRGRTPRLLLVALALGLGAAAVLAGVGATPAAAHAVLVSSSPADGAQLDDPPDVVRLTFSEPVSAELGGLRVLADDGTRVDEGAVRVDGAIVEVDLVGGLGDGSYVATWRIISADGHPVRGALVFAVGDADLEADRATLDGLFDDGADRAWDLAGTIGRWLAYGGVLVAAGGAVFLSLIHRGGAERAALVRLVVGASVIGAIGVVAALPIQAALATGQGPGALLEDGVAGGVLAEGVGWATYLGLVGLVALVLGIIHRSDALALAGAAVAAGSFAATGHNRSSDVELLATGAGVVHLWTAAVWLGGLVLLWRTIRSRRRDPDADPGTTAWIVGRFSTLATVSVVAVAGAGAVLSWSEVRSFGALTSTGYGALLLAKVGIVALVVAAGIYNNRVLVPAVAGGRQPAALPRLVRTVGFEGVALAVALAVTAVLVVETPARAAAETGGVVERVVELGDAGSVQVVVDPARTGDIEIHLYTYDPQGFPDDIAESITLELTQPDAGVGPLEREPFRAGPAHLQLDGAAFPVPGTWELTVRARIDRFTEATGRAEIDIDT
jgi:copper transport protein